MLLNPKLQEKQSKSFVVSDGAKKIFQAVYREKNKKEKVDDNEPKIKVSSLISKMAFYYEKIRNSVDYKEEHLLRKNAILRILKRQVLIEGVIQEVKSADVAKHLLVELIRAGYLPNNKIPVSRQDDIALIIDKYIKFKKAASKTVDFTDIKKRSDLNNWILATAACEIEEKLGRSSVTKVVISELYQILTSSIGLPENSLYKDDLEIQVFIGIHVNLLKYDKDMIGHIIFKYYNGDWENADSALIEKIGKNSNKLLSAINAQLNHPLAPQLNRIISSHAIYFSVLNEVISEDPVNVYNNLADDPKAFPRDIKKICKKRYEAAKSRLWRAAFRSIIYIFLTKSIFAMALEIPASRFFGETLNSYAILVNISFPALLLFFIVLFTKLPSDKNSEKIIEGINRIVFNEKKNDVVTLRPAVKRGIFINLFFNIFYSLTFLFSISMIIWFLVDIGFNFVSITIFLFFLAFVSFFAIHIRKGAHELIVIEEKESLVGFLVDFFYIPIVAVGKWLSEKFSRINVFVIILDFIIEAPFKIFVEIAEEWTKYVKERRDEIV